MQGVILWADLSFHFGSHLCKKSRDQNRVMRFGLFFAAEKNAWKGQTGESVVFRACV